MIKKIKKYWSEIAICICMCFCITTILTFFMNFKDGEISDDSENWSDLGGYIGGMLGTILSFFSVILIYATYKNQVSNSLLQQFETTFFNLLNNQREILNSLTGEFRKTTFSSFDEINDIDKMVKKKGDEYVSAVALEIYNRFDGRFRTLSDYEDEDLNSIIAISKSEIEKIINEEFEIVYYNKKIQLGHYFRHMYHIIKYITESQIENKKKYIDLIQAQMSDDELYITLYNCISKYGSEKFLPLLDKYGFFENIFMRGELLRMHAIYFYPKTKFKKSLH